MLQLIESPPDQEPFVIVQPGIEYKQYEGDPVLADIYTPTNAVGPFPAVIFIHGGMWIVNDRLQYTDFAIGMARSGFVSITIDYKTGFDGTFEQQVLDIKDAVRWVRQNADQYNIDPDRIGMFGSSSGGHLAALAAWAEDGEGLGDDPPGTDSTINSLYLLYGVYTFKAPVGGFIGRTIISFSGARNDMDQETFTKWSADTYINGGEPVTLMVHGTKDSTAPPEVAREIAEELRANGAPALVFPWPNGIHGFGELRPWTRPLIFYTVQQFFQATLGMPQ